MAFTDTELLLRVLGACAAAAPQPLFPADFTRETGVPRETLDQALDELRQRGLLQIAEWVKDQGQGYRLTPLGLDAVKNRSDLRKRVIPKTPFPVADETGTEHGDRARAPLFIPARPVICWTLIAVNVFVFVVGIFKAEGIGAPLHEFLKGSSREVRLTLFEMGALHPLAVWGLDQWWRLLSHSFLHFGVLHLLVNMYFLYALGPLIEAMWGSGRFLMIYFVAGLTGGCLVLAVERDGLTAGSSGALCGIAGSMAVWLLLNRAYLPPELYASLARNIAINFVLIFGVSLISGVSWEGHLGGAVGGALAAFPMQLSRYGRGWLSRIFGIVGGFLVPIVLLGLTIATHWWRG